MTPTPQQVLEAQLSEDRWEREREGRMNVDWPDIRDLPDLSYGQDPEPAFTVLR